MEDNTMAGNLEEQPRKSEAVQGSPEKTDETKNQSAVDTPKAEEETKTDFSEKLSNEVSEKVSGETPEISESVNQDSQNAISEKNLEATASVYSTADIGEETPKAATNSEDEDNTHSDHEELHEEDHEEIIDYSNYSKKELCKAIASFSKDEDGYKKGKAIFAIKEAYDHIFEEEKSTALEKFIADGESEDDFEYRLDEISQQFEAYFKIIREKRTRNARELEQQKEQNLAKKTELLERIRVFVDNDENTASINELKVMQEEWKTIGPVPHVHNKTLWANYNALMDRYYDHRSIYFELKELDRKKNLTAKLELCKQAESLDKLENLNEAITKLNELHEEYKHIGPIPKEQQEETWQRFKAASDKVYAKRKDYFAHLKEAFEENFVKKTALAEEAILLESYTSENIGEWNAKTKEVLELQKRWEAIGSMPKEKAKEVNRKFWSGFKTFFKHKSDFFKALDNKREENLVLKQELISKAKELKESSDWNKTANALKDLQKQWKEVGPVPEKKRESIYKEFKAACDEFFNRKRENSKGLESSYEDNLKQKQAICDEIEALATSEELDPESIYELQDKYNAIGFVPKKAIKSIQNRYKEALSKVMNQAKGMDTEQLDEFKSLVSINRIKAGPHGDQKLQRKEQALKRKIQHLENDISTWKNNIGFFASSKNANALLADFETKIEKAEAELLELKEELKIISYAG
ncbi:DUF349 domain-containing protein [Reichenbachiella versicolor]|uniref:DUF349 domain-containing protein n=1 Tax=Reichenbachiella versicolor TaxID=1821036 RepID=UPI000D6E6A22|nr:DUF349 domain-containing protein [Reichenbachiella versicolor]